ncbi:hypothetical protein JW766_05370, partial [Candidatus Dojkabacteria bacterium]|nr:hypothetical protein [Candidatus Dojkabacteria bacterium]
MEIIKLLKNIKRYPKRLGDGLYQKPSGGFSIIEVILAIAVFALFVTSFIGAIIYGEQSSAMAGTRGRAVFLADEAIEAVMSIRDDAWNEIIYSQSAVDTTGSRWNLTGEGSTETIGPYTRVITFSDVCRDGSDNIVDCPGSYTDIHTKKVTVTVTWTGPTLASHTVDRVTYINNWQSLNWMQTDWAGGSGQSVWSDATMFESDDGNIDVSTAGEAKLAQGTIPCGTKVWPFNVAGNYSYDSGKIEVTGGFAQLRETAPGTGQITDTPVDSLEYDNVNGLESQILRVSGDIYAISYRGEGDGGYLKTVETATNGQITDTVIDSLE